MVEIININGKLGIQLPSNVIKDLNLSEGDVVYLEQIGEDKYELSLPEYTKSEWIKAVDLADYIIWKCNRDNNLINNYKLQKIIAKIYKHFKREHHLLIFPDEVEIWKFGMVVPDVYYKYSSFGGTSILMINTNYKPKIIQVLSRELVAEIDKIIVNNRNKPIWLL